MILPPGVLPRPEHPTQRSLDLLDAGLVLCFNTTLHRYEVWRREVGLFRRVDGKPGREARADFGFIVRVVGENGTGYAEPGEWLLNRLRERDSRYRPAAEAAKVVLDEIKAEERAAAEADEHRLDAVREEVVKDYLPLWRQKADPHHEGRRYHDWRTEPVQIPTAKSEVA